MQFVINCMGLPFNGDTLNQKSLGGSETAALQLCQELAKAGHTVKVFTTIGPEDEGTFSGVDYFSCGQVSEGSPLGDRFHFYAENTPHDVCIIQRNPQAFNFRYASKINLWWVHDLALHRTKHAVQQQMWNIDGVLCVSEFHKEQICKVYGLNPEIVFVLNNGVDPALFDVEPMELPSDRTDLVYISRPERGLSNLLKTGGIMDELGDDYHLHICAYDNVTREMRPYYESLWANANARPNVTNHGALAAKGLYSLLKGCDLMVYPTPSDDCLNFEEVSCIAMMEAMHSGLPVVTSAHGALSETCSVSDGVALIELADGHVDAKQFAEKIKSLTKPKIEKMSALQLEASSFYSWSNSCDSLLTYIGLLFSKNRNPANMLSTLIRFSDIFEAKKLVKAGGEDSRIYNSKAMELSQCYDFLDNMGDHYESFYTLMDAQGEGPKQENLSNSGRFNVVSSLLSGLPDPTSWVLDYGCGHGHYTINLANKYPAKRFVGVDISAKNIEFAKQWAKQSGVKNVEFFTGETDKIPGHKYGAIICAEVLEHVENPEILTDTLASHLSEDGKMILTTPYGSWEAESYIKRWPFREHLWHFEKADLQGMFGMHDDFECFTSPCGINSLGDQIGSYITTFKRPSTPSETRVGTLALVKPRQTLSLMMMIKDCEDTLLKSLRSVDGIIDEVVIGVDPTTRDFDELKCIVERFCNDKKVPFELFKLSSPPLKQGFGPARNEILNKCCGDWVLTLDSDEVLVNSTEMHKYLRNNQFAGYALKQHHFSNDPVGVLKTDYPCKIFRKEGIQFFGLIHEHPETDLNKGVGMVDLIPDVTIAHYGYDDEKIRRKRFSRNFELMKKDREIYPDRKLSKMLWIRDLFQVSKYEMEHNGGHVTQDMIDRVGEGRKLWDELLSDKDSRLVIDSLEFLTELNKIKGDGFWYNLRLDTNFFGEKPEGKDIVCYLHSKEAAKGLFNLIFEPKMELFKNRYL